MLAEVMDKEFPIDAVWGICLTIAILGFGLCSIRWWLLLLVLPVAWLFAYLQWAELSDPFVGPAILREAGYGYVVQSYVAIALSFATPLAGALCGKKLRTALRSR